jgi:hypothetical protein
MKQDILQNRAYYGFKELTLKNSWQSINIFKIIDESNLLTSDNP